MRKQSVQEEKGSGLQQTMDDSQEEQYPQPQKKLGYRVD